MSLAEIKNRLYKKDDKAEAALADKELEEKGSGWEEAEASIEPKKKEPIPENQVESENSTNFQKVINPEPVVWEEPAQGLSQKNRKMLKILGLILGSIFLLAAIIIGIGKYKAGAFSQERVEINWKGPTETLSGKAISYKITWQNNNRASLKGAILKIDLPKAFYLDETGENLTVENDQATVNLGEIKGNSSGELSLSGKLYSPKGAFVYLNATLGYQPANLSTRFEKTNQIGLMSTSSPVILELSYPTEVSSGASMRYEIVYKNTAGIKLSNLKIKAQYPGGFTFLNSDPNTSLENGTIWSLGDLEANQEGKIVIDGKLEGAKDEVKKASFLIGVSEGGKLNSYNDEDATTKITSSPFSIYQTINNADSLIPTIGQKMDFRIFFKNEGDIGLRDVIVTEKLDGYALDLTSLEMEAGGNYNSEDRTITWKASQYPELANLQPGQGGMIKFSISVRKVLPISKATDKNFAIKSLATIDSPDIPTPIDTNKTIASNLTVLRVSSPVYLETLGFYKDSTIENSGPLPPKVGEETTYTIHWKVSSLSNDLKNAKVSASLLGNTTFTGIYKPENENVSFNSRTNELIWDLGDVAAGTGVLKDKREVVFQIKLKPTLDQLGETANLLSASTLTAQDVFTGKNVTIQTREKSTRLTEDSEFASGDERVVK